MASISDRSSSLISKARRSLAGSVEDDTFWINDVLLTIPPTQIQVEKQSFDYSWQTLRTTTSTTLKSGHSQVRVSISVVFQDLDTLAQLWAGFRATPFCAVFNAYLSDKINSIEPNADSYNQYKVLQPIVLALSSATFSTMGHEGLVDCIQGRLEFVYFNYHPYTPIFAYKTGPNNDVPGPAFESGVWRAFYSPFISKSVPRYPNFDPKKSATRFDFSEFTSRPYGTKEGMAKSKELVDTLRLNPSAFIDALSAVQKDAKVNTRNVYDALHKKLLDNGVLKTDRGSIYTPDNDTTATASGSPVLDPLLQKILNTRMKAGYDPVKDAVASSNTEINDAVVELERRMNLLSQAEEEAAVASGQGDWNLVGSANRELKTSDRSYGLGGFKLFTRPRSLTCSPDNGFVVEQVTISMRNILAMVPMVGYTYPTIQHLGSNDVVLVFSINATNSAAGKLHRLYDMVENTNNYFRSVPQGIRNLVVRNDFLGIFGYKEFTITGLSSTTIPNQPGRTSLTFELAQVAVDVNSSFDEPEVINQEFVASSERARREVWNVMGKYLRRTEARREQGDPKYRETFKQEICGIVQDGRTNAFCIMLKTAMDTYNEFIYSVVEYFFSSKTSNVSKEVMSDERLRGISKLGYHLRTEKAHLLQQFISLPENTYGWTPMMGEVRAVLLGCLSQHTAGGVPGPSAKTANQAELMKKLMGNKAEVRGGRTPGEIELQNALQAMKFFEYQTAMFKLLDNIISEYLHLDQFKSLKDMIKQEGLFRGRMAYPDFAPQLTALAKYSEDKETITDAQLLDYEPDAYLWYPITSQVNTSGDMFRILDSGVIAEARRQSLKSFKTAHGSVDNFFQRTYLEMIKNVPNFDTNRKGKSPYETLIANVGKSGNHIPDPYYNKVRYSNSSQGEDIKHLVIPDTVKAQTNWPKQRGEQIRSNYALQHSTDLNELWDGIESGCAPQEGLGDDETKQSRKPDKSYQPSEVQGGIAGEWGVEARSFQFPRPASEQEKSREGWVCPIASYSSKQDDGAVGGRYGVRDIDKNQTIASKKDSFFDIRRNAAKPDWAATASILQRAGCVNPATVEKSIGPISTWTYEKYAAWKKSHPGQRVGYLHKGIDLVAPVGTDVYAIGDGTIRYASKKPTKGCGLFIEINHPNGWTSRYLHLQAIDPDILRGKTKRVKAGDCIAVSGRSGQTKMGPHLHFEIYSKYVGYQNMSNKLEDPNKAGIPWRSKPTKKGRAAAKRTEAPKEGPVADKIAASATAKVPTDITTTMSSPLVESIKAFETDMLSGQGQSILRAYPTFKLYFIEDDMDERRRLAFDDFFSYSAVKSIRVVRSKEIAADLCVLELTNISGVLSNRKFKQEEHKLGTGRNQIAKSSADAPHTATGEKSRESILPADANTKKENPIASMMLQEGIQIHLRLGYSSDPDRLIPVFTGKITNVEFSESEDLIQVVAQSYAVELVQDIKGLETPKAKVSPWWASWGFHEDASTGRILEEMMASPELVHFGRWTPDANGTANRELLTNRWTYEPQPADDNIFAPPLKAERLDIGTGMILKDLVYIIYRTTVWDIFQEMTMRHPNFIAAPVPYKDKYGERMTMFFGMPNQLYFARHPTAEENVAQERIKDEERQARARIMMLDPTVSTIMGAGNYNPAAALNTKVAAALGANPALLASMYYQAKQKFGGDTLTEALKIVEESTRNSFRIKRLEEAKKAGYIAPFRKYHLLTSRHHIVSNNIQTNSRDVTNTAFIYWPEKVDLGDKNTAPAMNNIQYTIMKVDNALPQEDMKVQYGQYVNAVNENLARRYALSVLRKGIQKAYKGELIVIGNAAIKPHDVCFIMDEASDMSGPIEVRQIVHLMNQDNGFITEIQPDMLVAAADWSLLTTCEAMGIVVNGAVRKFFGDDAANITLPGGKTGTAFLGAVAKMFGANTWNCFLNDKIVNYTQTGQPLVMAPLTHHGRPFAGGIPIRKLPQNIWRTIFGDWYNEADAVYSDWLDDLWRGIKNTTRTVLGGHTTGSFSKGFSHNTLEVD